jgi:biotin synthase
VSWRIESKVEDLLKKGGDRIGLDASEAEDLLRLELGTKEVYALMETANRISRQQFGNKGETHFHIGINLGPCAYNCGFCSLATGAGIFSESIEFGEEDIIRWAKDGESQGADALNLMTTGTFRFERLLEIGRLLRREVAVPLVANTRDLDHEEAEKLLEAGFVGAYHAVRLGEGKDTPFTIEKRLKTIDALKDVGLLWMNCIEPVGPEHTPEEMAFLMVMARRRRAVYSGAMRRINFPGSPVAGRGMITELELARIVAVSRLVMGDVPQAHCTHEPHAASLIAGANLLFPEVGSSPRDGQADTGKGRGRNLTDCRKIFMEMGWNPDLASNCFKKGHQRRPNQDLSQGPAENRNLS